MVSTLAATRVPVKTEAVRDLCRRHHIRRLSLFGSVLRDDFRADSDVDVLVEFEPGRVPGFFGFAEVSFELEELFGRAVDLHTPASLSQYFRDEVMRAAEPLYGTT